MNRLRNETDVFYTGPLMKKGLEEYMNRIDNQYMIVKERKFTNAESSGPWFMCHYCGSGGPFVVNFYGGMTKDEITRIHEDFKLGRPAWRKDIIETLGSLVRTKYHVTVKDGELHLRRLGNDQFNVMTLQYELLEQDSHYVEHLQCANCGGICDIAMETLEYDGGIHPDEVDMYGNQMFITDESTELKQNFGKNGEVIGMEYERITREGLMDECIRCMYHEDTFIHEYASAVVARKVGDKNNNQDIELCGSICEWNCPHSHDFWLFRIRPVDIQNRKLGIMQYNPKQVEIGGSDGEA
jgi:hypothetical protein